ncbi:MAG: hypothetical protein ACYDCD_08970 [Candidatus Acidiferrales bacterium]
MTVFAVTLAALAILLALFWLLFGSPATETPASLDARDVEEFLPANCRHFPQIRQMLETEDHQFIRRRAPRHIEVEWRGERRRILGQYLKGLGQDFVRLERLARLIATISPEIRRAQEWEWMWLGIRFRILYRSVELKIALGSFSADDIARLTDPIAGLAAELESRMSLIAECAPSRLHADFGS